MIFCAWNPNGGYPVCNAKLPDGTTGWSMQVIPTRTANHISRACPAELPRIAKINSFDTSTTRTLTLEMLIEQSLTFTKASISMLITYEQTDGTLKTINTYDPFGAALTASTTDWTPQISSSQVLYAGAITLNKYKMSVTTPTEIKAGSEISIFVRVHQNVTNTTTCLFIDPTITVA
jgi:hypothetical protein